VLEAGRLTWLVGFGYHADFIMGWKGDLLQKAADTCTNPSGKIGDCPVFTIQDEDHQVACGLKKIPQKLVQEVVSGMVGTSLPGGVQIQYGPGPATQAKPSPSPTATVEVPTVSYSPGTTGTSSGSVLPGQVFKETAHSKGPADVAAPATTSDAAPSPSAPATSEPTASPAKPTFIAGIVAPDAGSAAAPSPAPTPATSPEISAAPGTTAAPATAPADDGLRVVSTQYVTSGNVVSEVVWKEAVVYVTETDDVTVTVTVQQPTPSVQAVRRLRRGHGHEHFHRRLRHAGRR
jgi:hypothetical protein